jgi:Zn-dependent metalloprotease
MCSRNPLHCVIPPHILLHLAREGTAAQREWAAHALLASERMRGERQVNAQLFVGSPTGTKRRTIFTAGGQQVLPGKLVRGEGAKPSKDKAVNQAYEGLGSTYDFYNDVFKRNSLDGNGLRLDATVHYDYRYPNAFWNGRQMVFGDGDGVIFGSFTESLDVIAHELTHGVVEYSAALVYQGQSGALNESMADVFGSLVKQKKLGQTAQQADWLVGEEVLLPGVKGVAIRSLKAPGSAYNDPRLGGKDPQPAHMKDFVKTAFDNGGVHVNSGIPNHAFYLVAHAFGGNAWEKAGRIWYHALTQRLNAHSTFQDAANLTYEAAGALFGATEQKVVQDAWHQVGITVQLNVHKIFAVEVPAELAVTAGR